MAIVKNGMWIDAKGDAVPPKYIDPIDKKRDRLVTGIIKKAEKLSNQIAKFKKEVFEEIENYLRWVEEKYDTKVMTQKGNKQLSDFSNIYRVEILISNVIEFDERLQIAKGLIDECIEEWSDNVNNKIKVLVEHAFKVDKKGNLDKKRILGLRQLKIKDAKWKKAMEIIEDSMKIVDKRRYVRFSKKDENGKWQTIPIDISQV